MHIFKAYFTIMKKYLGLILMYFGIFLAISLILVKVQESDDNNKFTDEKLTIGLIDKDGKSVGKSIEKYFGEKHRFKKIKYQEKDIMEDLYWRRMDYVLVIPKGFEESLKTDGKAKEISCMKVPGYFGASYFESELNMYMSKLTGLLASGYSMNEAENVIGDLNDTQTSVEIASFVNKKQGDNCTRFFLLVPYLFISVGIIGVGMVLLRMNDKEIKERTECGKMPLRKRTAGMTTGIFVFGFAIYLSVIIIAVIISKGDILTDIRFPYFLLNMFAMLLFSLSVGFLTGMIAKGKETINGIVNVVGLALCFFGGVFVPQEFFGKGVEKVAKFFPTYWYVATNEQVGGMKEMSPELLNNIMSQTGLILSFALAVFAVTLVLISCKRKRNV